MVPFIRFGLEQHEKCLYIVDDRNKKEVIKAFRRAGVELDPYLASNQLEFLTKKETYLQQGYFAPSKMINLLRNAEATALAEGYTGLRVTGEMTWFYSDMPGVDQFIEYEAKLNDFLSDSHTVALCQYNEQRFSPTILMDVIHTHPRLILYGTLCENPYYLPPGQVLDRRKGGTSRTLYHTMIQQIQERTWLRQRYQVFFEVSPDPVFLLNAEGVFIDVNPAAVQTLGFERSEIVDSTLWNAPFFPKETVEKTTKNFTRRKQGEDVPPYTVKLTTKEGEYILGEVNVGTFGKDNFEGEIVIARDITEREQKEEKLKEAEERFRSIVENANDGIYIRDKDGTITYVNQKFADIHGYPLEEILNEKSWAFIHPDTLKKLRQDNTLEKIRQGKPQRRELKIRTKSGEIKYVDSNTVPITQEGGVTKIIGIIRDITELKRREQDLRQYKRILEASEDLNVAVNEEYVYLFANETFLDYHQLDREQVVGHTVAEVVGEQMFKEKIKPYVDQCLQGETIQYEMMYAYPVRGTRHLEIRYYPLPQEHTERPVIVANLRDITERKELEEKLSTLHTWAQKLNRATNMKKIFEYTLDAMEQTLGFAQATIQLKKQTTLNVEASRGYESLPVEVLKLPLDGLGITVKVANTGKPILANDVTEHAAYVPATPEIKSELVVPITVGGEVIGVLNAEREEVDAFNHEDVLLLETLAAHVGVAIKELQERKKRVSLQRLDELRNQFLAMAAHEINTPLTPIKTNLELLQKEYLGTLSREQHSKIKQMLESVDRLMLLVNDFRQISKLRTEQIEVDMEEYQLANTIEKALTKYTHAIKEEDLTLIKHIEQSLTAIYDEDRIVQVLRNLVENAIDYTNHTIWIEGKAQKGHIQVSVRDDGPGIPEDEQDKIFQPFYRLEGEARSRENRQFGGTGLGLNICKRIVEAHGGKLRVDSTLGEGSTFTLTLPKNPRNLV